MPKDLKSTIRSRRIVDLKSKLWKKKQNMKKKKKFHRNKRFPENVDLKSKTA